MVSCSMDKTLSTKTKFRSFKIPEFESSFYDFNQRLNDYCFNPTYQTDEIKTRNQLIEDQASDLKQKKDSLEEIRKTAVRKDLKKFKKIFLEYGERKNELLGNFYSDTNSILEDNSTSPYLSGAEEETIEKVSDIKEADLKKAIVSSSDEMNRAYYRNLARLRHLKDFIARCD
jgi:hypothetical protein